MIEWIVDNRYLVGSGVLFVLFVTVAIYRCWTALEQEED